MATETQNLSIRSTPEIANTFKNLAIQRNQSQGELLGDLLALLESSQELQKNALALPQTQAPPYPIKLLICDGTTCSKTLRFNGELVLHMQTPRPFYSFKTSKTYFDNLVRDRIRSYEQNKVNQLNASTEPNHYEYSYENPEYSTAYQCSIYKTEDTGDVQYIIYEYIGILDIYENILFVNIKRACRAQNLSSILQAMACYLSVQETDQLKLELSESCNILELASL